MPSEEGLKEFCVEETLTIKIAHAIALSDFKTDEISIKCLNNKLTLLHYAPKESETFEELKYNLESIQENLNVLITQDSILHHYVEGTYCEIDLNPVIPKSEKNSDLKKQAIVLNILEYCNYLIKLFDFICIPKRDEKIKCIGNQIYKTMSQLMDLYENKNNLLRDSSKDNILQDLTGIVKEIYILYNNIVCDCLDFAILKNHCEITSWIENLERRNFMSSLDNNLVEDHLKEKDLSPSSINNKLLPYTFKWITEQEDASSCLLLLKYNQFMNLKFVNLLSFNHPIPETITFMDKEIFEIFKLSWRFLIALKWLLSNIVKGDNQDFENFIEIIRLEFDPFDFEILKSTENITDPNYCPSEEDKINRRLPDNFTTITDEEILIKLSEHLKIHRFLLLDITKFDRSNQNQINQSMTERLLKFMDNSLGFEEVPQTCEKDLLKDIDLNSLFDFVFIQRFCWRFKIFKKHNMNVFYPVYITIFKSLQ